MAVDVEKERTGVLADLFHADAFPGISYAKMFWQNENARATKFRNNYKVQSIGTDICMRKKLLAA